MGTCFSKKNISSSSPAPATKEAAPARGKEEDSISNTKKKEIFVIKHTNSYRERQHQQPEATESGEGVAIITRVRSSSCSKEEVDAILIQCGRLSRSGSLGKKSASARRRRSGSKTSFDFDEQLRREEEEGDLGGDEASAATRESRRQHHHRRDSQSSRNSSPAGRRRTPSRERDGGRRVSLSPRRRSGNLTASGNLNAVGNCNAATNATNRPPGKMVSVPPTVSSSAAPQAGIRRISVQRNVGAASPRSQSPSGNQQQPSPRRSLTRKAEHSPYRRNPLAEINSNSLAYPPANGEKFDKNNVQITGKESIQKPHPFQQKASMAATEEIINPSRPRSRSARRSRDMDDINPPEGLLNHHQQPTTYTSMLLQDINNFHHKSNNINIRNNNDNNKSNAVPSSFELPDCLKKACSILEAVADLNSTPIRVPLARQQQEQQIQIQFSGEVNKVDSFPPLESMDDDSMEPSFGSYVTVRRGSGGVSCSGEEDIGMLQEQGRNSNNVDDSADRWKEKGSRCNVVPMGLGIGDRVHGLSERAGGIGSGIGGRMEEKGFNGGRRNGIGRGSASIASSSST